MPAAFVTAERGFELLQQVALLGGEVDRRLHRHPAVPVAGVAAAHRAHALAAQAEHLAGLGLGGDADLRLAVEGRHVDRIAQGRLRNADRHLAVQVIAVAPEDRVLAHPHFHVQVARRRARRPGLALALQADAVAAVHPRGDLHRQHLLVLDPARPMAALARIADHLAAAAAFRARLLHGEDAALEAHLAAAAAGRTGFDLAILRT